MSAPTPFGLIVRLLLLFVPSASGLTSTALLLDRPGKPDLRFLWADSSLSDAASSEKPWRSLAKLEHVGRTRHNFEDAPGDSYRLPFLPPVVRNGTDQDAITVVVAAAAKAAAGPAAASAAKEAAREITAEVLRSLGIINNSNNNNDNNDNNNNDNENNNKKNNNNNNNNNDNVKERVLAAIRARQQEAENSSVGAHAEPGGRGEPSPQDYGYLTAILRLPSALLQELARFSLFVLEPLQRALDDFLRIQQERAAESAESALTPRFSPSGFALPPVNGSAATAAAAKGGGRATRTADPIGISIGSVLAVYGIYSVLRGRREANRIISLFEANTQIKELSEKAARGEPLPSIVVIRGHIASDGGDIGSVSTRIEGLRDRVGEIEQPKNAWIEIARQAKRDPQLRGIADAVVERTGVDADDIPDVPEPGDPSAARHVDVSRGDGPHVLTEILVARICAKHQRRNEDIKTKRVTIKRPCRNESYNCFHGRRVSEGLHIIGLDGSRADLELPPADAVGLAGISEPPPLFLPVSDIWTEFTHYLRKDGLTGPGGKRQKLDDLPPMRLSDPYTLLSEFIFLDVQSPGDLGGFSSNPGVLSAIAEAYRSSQGPAKFLWEPRGFYDSVRGGSYDDLPSYTSTKFRRTEMVGAAELTERAQAAARENSRSSPYCEPSFSRSELEQRRDLENCFRYTELAIPRGTPVTILARPMIAEAGTGEGAECRIRLASPLSFEASAPLESGIDPKVDRFRFRILKGHRVENLLRQRDPNVLFYYILAVLGLALIAWAATGYPGVIH